MVNSAIVKLGKLMPAQKVYRGITGGLLPNAFWRRNEFNVRGGVEYAFMSTTSDKKVAMEYAAGSGKQGIVFEIQMGMLDRGADLSWISQYPHEREILFAPLTGCEAASTRVEGSVLVVDVRLNVNLRARTIEQVVARMRNSHLELIELMSDNFRTVQWRRVKSNLARLPREPRPEALCARH